MNDRGIALLAYGLARRVSHMGLARRLIPQALRTRLQRLLVSRVMDRLPDRRYLEGTIFPVVALLEPRRLLDVGVQDYTRHHGAMLPPSCELWTADVDPAAAGFGAPGRHVVAGIAELDRHLDAGSFDVILLNGLFGHGVDRLEEQEKAVIVARRLLRPGGWLLVGWNRGGDGRPIIVNDGVPGELRIRDPLELSGIAEGFKHAAPQPLPARREFKNSSHVFDWFRAR